MKIQCIIDTANDDPNWVGEYLRDWAFLAQVGCYSCFDLIPSFLKHDWTHLNPKMKRYFFEHCDDDEDRKYTSDRVVCYTYHQPGEDLTGTQVAWVWDGDGDLAFLLPDDTMFTNSDCKKDYRWERV